MWPNLYKTADLFTFIEEIFKRKLYFLYTEIDAFFKAFIEALIFILKNILYIKSNQMLLASSAQVSSRFNL